MFFKKIRVNDGDVVYLFEYCTSTFGYDDRSRLVLDFKNGMDTAVQIVYDQIIDQLGTNFALVCIPKSDAAKEAIAANKLIAKIVTEHPEKGLVNASQCYYRTFSKDPNHTSGKSDLKIHYDSTAVRFSELIKDKDVLIVDDVITRGYTFKAAYMRLKEAGARTVVGFAIGRTIKKEITKLGFIFDLDQTLYNTDKIKIYRDTRQWTNACKYAKECPMFPGIKKLIQTASSVGEIVLVTSSPGVYAKTFARFLDIPDSHIVAYHDTKQHKPNIEPYCKAKQILQTYEKCIIVFGDQKTDIIPAYELGMTSVYCTWGITQIDDSAKKMASYTFKTVANLIKHFDEITENARGMQNKCKY